MQTTLLLPNVDFGNLQTEEMKPSAFCGRNTRLLESRGDGKSLNKKQIPRKFSAL